MVIVKKENKKFTTTIIINYLLRIEKEKRMTFINHLINY
jgi:hypothetical protein